MRNIRKYIFNTLQEKLMKRTENLILIIELSL